MRIIHVCSIKYRANGICTVLERLVPCQRNLGHDVEVFNFCDGGIEDKLFHQISINEFKAMAKADRPDVVIFHGVFYWALIRLSDFLIRNGIPFFIELHGALSMQNMQKSHVKKKVFQILFLNRSIKKSKAIIYLNHSEYCNSAIKNLNSRCIIIPNGCNIPRIPLIQKGKSESKIELLFLGRIDIQHKGLDVLIQAIKYLKNQNKTKNLHFSFYGIGNNADMEYLKREMAPIGDVATYYGAVYGADKQQVFSKADIFIHPSRYEGFPMAILEALSVGLPCIISPMTNVSDIILSSDCGWITTLDPVDIAETMLRAKTEFLTKRNNCRQAIDALTWDNIAKDSIEKYFKLLNRAEI